MSYIRHITISKNAIIHIINKKYVDIKKEDKHTHEIKSYSNIMPHI